MDRRKFLKQTLLTSTAFVAAPVLPVSQTFAQGENPLPVEKVKEFVMAGHGNIDKVKTMLAELPTLIYATYDWKNGDFETALEGAGHVGNKEIANYLINLGARTNLFVLTMLGKTALVKEYLTLFPSYITARGPHGLTLLHHAQKGGEDSRELLEFLQSKGLKDMKSTL